MEYKSILYGFQQKATEAGWKGNCFLPAFNSDKAGQKDWNPSKQPKDKDIGLTSTCLKICNDEEKY